MSHKIIENSMDLSLTNKVVDALSSMEFLAFFMLFVAIGYTWGNLAPEPLFSDPVFPTHFSIINCALFAVLFAVVRLLPKRRLKLERLSLALFLAGMPIIYLWSALIKVEGVGVLVELVGVFIFISIAAWGYIQSDSPLILCVGILMHGIGWDIWHPEHSVSIESWYSIGCLVIDIALSFLVLTQLKAHRDMSRKMMHRFP